jgi:uncharacterized membrane protein
MKENTLILVKTITYRVTSSLATFIIAWLATGSYTTGGIVAISRGLFGTVWYAVHEKIWSVIKKNKCW